MNKILASLLISAGVIVAIPTKVFAESSFANEQFLVRGNGAEPASLDPTYVQAGMPEDIISGDLFEGLLLEDSQGQIIPGQASQWEVSDDGKQITFTLRESLKWSNGEPVLASDFVYAWQRAVDPKSGNTTNHYYVTANILNAEEIIKGNKPVSELGIKALDEKTIQVTLSKPTPYFLSLMTIKTFFPLPQKVVEKYGEQWTRAENIVTNGAYKLMKWVPNEYVEVQRNAHYWDNESTTIEKVTYLGLASQNAELIRYQAGEIDMTNRVQLEYYQKYKQENPEFLYSQSLLGTYLYSFNTRKTPFNDAKVRRALSMAVDRDVLVTQLLGQGEQAAYSLISPTITGYESTQPDYKSLDQTQRLAQAKQLLEQAGYNAANPLTFTITYNTSENHKKIALALASMWKSLGVNVQLVNMEWQGYLVAKSEGDFEVARSSSFADYPEPSGFLNSFTCGHVNNESGYCNQDFDNLMLQASNVSDQTARFQLYQQAEDILNQDQPFIPLNYYIHTRLVNPKLRGLPENNPRGNIYAKDLYFVK